MLPPAELTLWLLTSLVEAFAVYLFLVQGLSRKFLMLNLYFLFCAVIGASRFAVFHHSGFLSVEYVYFYYYSDTLLTVFLFLSICELSLRLAGTRISRKRIVLGGAVAFLAVSLFNASAASFSNIQMMSHFVVELSQDLYFASALAIALLWVWKAFDAPEDRVAARFVDVIFVSVLMFILLYGERELAPQVAVNNKLPQMMAVWLPVGCAFIAVSLASANHQTLSVARDSSFAQSLRASEVTLDKVLYRRVPSYQCLQILGTWNWLGYAAVG